MDKSARCLAHRSQQIERWRADLDRIRTEVLSLFWRRKVFRHVFDVIEANPRIDRWNPLYDWMQINYVAAVAMAIRRVLELDNRNRPVTLAHLVESVSSSAHLISRDWYISLCYPRMTTRREAACRDFARFADVTGRHLDPEHLRTRLSAVRESAKLVGECADKVLAHSDRHPPKDPLTYEGLDEVIDSVGELLQETHVVLTGVWLGDLEIAEQYDWQWIFTEPWVPQVGDDPLDTLHGDGTTLIR